MLVAKERTERWEFCPCGGGTQLAKCKLQQSQGCTHPEYSADLVSY